MSGIEFTHPGPGEWRADLRSDIHLHIGALPNGYLGEMYHNGDLINTTRGGFVDVRDELIDWARTLQTALDKIMGHASE